MKMIVRNKVIATAFVVIVVLSAAHCLYVCVAELRGLGTIYIPTSVASWEKWPQVLQW